MDAGAAGRAARGRGRGGGGERRGQEAGGEARGARLRLLMEAERGSAAAGCRPRLRSAERSLGLGLALGWSLGVNRVWPLGLGLVLPSPAVVIGWRTRDVSGGWHGWA